MQRPAANRLRRSVSVNAVGTIWMRAIYAALIAAFVFSAGMVCAQENPKQGDTSADESPSSLHLSDIMARQQMRHIKLWFAGEAGDWPLSDYEVDALKEGFEEIAQLLGDEIVRQHVGGAISDLEKSIDAKDRNAFVTAFDRLSAGCNACHHTLDHAFIVIQRPVLLPYSDQSFSPEK